MLHIGDSQFSVMGFHTGLSTQHEGNGLFSSHDRKYVLKVERSSEVCLFMMQQSTGIKS